MKGSGVALGVNDDFDYEQYQRSGLAKGQIIAVGTDGIWEAINKEGEMFGKARLKKVIRENARASAIDILNAVYTDLNSFISGQKSADDITLVIIKAEGMG